MKKLIAFILIGLFFCFPVFAGTENFTNWTEVDPNNHLSQTTGKSSWTLLDRNEDAYTYYDFGASHFDGDFEHLLEFKWTVSNGNSVTYPWAMGLELQQGVGMTKLSFYSYNNSIRIQETETNDSNHDGTVVNLTINTQYYITIERDESVGTYGTLYVRVYSDAARETLVGTSTLALSESKKDFRYLYAPAACNTGNSGLTETGYTENLDIQEAVAAEPRRRGQIISFINKLLNI